MLSIFSYIISLITFPGVIVHEFAHKKFCDWFGVPVLKVSYFRLGNPLGYVTHVESESYWKNFWITFGPLIFNSFFAVIFGFFCSQFKVGTGSFLFFLWLSLSCGIHSFPSNQDAKSMLESGKNKFSIFYFLTYPFAALIFLANKLKYFLFDLWYALFLAGLGMYLSSLM